MFSLLFFLQILFLGEGLYYNSLKEEEEKTDRGPEGGNNKTKQKRIRMEVEAGIECERASCMCCVCVCRDVSLGDSPVTHLISTF